MKKNFFIVAYNQLTASILESVGLKLIYKIDGSALQWVYGYPETKNFNIDSLNLERGTYEVRNQICL